MACVVYSDDAEKRLKQANANVQEQVIKRIDKANNFPEHFLKRYSGSPYYKLRAGDYRAVVDWRKGEDPEVLYIRGLGTGTVSTTKYL